MSKKQPGPRWLAVCDPMNSTCDSADLHDLDWSNWWEDNSFGLYLHVRHVDDVDGVTWHCVLPKPSAIEGCCPIWIGVRNGRPFWITEQIPY